VLKNSQQTQEVPIGSVANDDGKWGFIAE